MRTRLLALVALPLALTACSSSGASSSSSDDQHKDAGYVTSSDLGTDWPLTVDSGTLHCDGSGGSGSVTFTSGGTKYALNGTAIQRGDGADIDPIWAAGDGLIPKKDISPLIDKGLELCK